MEQKNINAVLLSAVIAANVYKLPVSFVVNEDLSIPIRTSNTLITGTQTLARNINIELDPDLTPNDGFAYTINWRCALDVNGHTLSIQSTNVTTLVTGEKSIDFRIIYLNGAWEVSNIVSEVNDILDAYVFPVISVAGKTGAVTLVKADVGLGNVDNTSDVNKPVSTATGIAISNAQSASSAVGAAAQVTANSALSIATGASSAITAMTKLAQVATWAAGTQPVVPNANFYSLNVVALNGNVTINVTPLTDATAVSEITIFLGFTGIYTVTAGSNCVFNTITGAGTVIQVLTLAWNGTAYIKKSLA